VTDALAGEMSSNSMQMREWRTVDKAAWPAGPWHDEPDKRQWRDPETGFPCMVVRSSSGNLCGYVGVPLDHPLYGCYYGAPTSKLTEAWEKRKERPLGNQSEGPISILLAALADKNGEPPSPSAVFEVHGGLTYSDRCPPLTRETWETWREAMFKRRDEAEKYPQGDAARALREWATALESYDAWVEQGQAVFLCSVPDPGEEDDDSWWFGFDCGHSGDFQPGYAVRLPEGFGDYRVYRELPYVEAEVASLARQLAEVSGAG